MESTYINTLTLKEYHVIKSKKTSRPYVDINNGCYLFELRSEAENFTKQIKDTEFDNARYLKQAVFCTEFYSYGIDEIHVKGARQKEIVIPLSANDVARQFYNRETIRSLLRLKQTGKKQYLYELKNAFFISPVIIDPRPEKQYPIMHYSYASTTNKNTYFILFTTIQEYNLWNKEQKESYKPLKIRLHQFRNIRKQNPVLINPMSDKIVLNDKQISLITKGINDEESIESTDQ